MIHDLEKLDGAVGRVLSDWSESREPLQQAVLEAAAIPASKLPLPLQLSLQNLLDELGYAGGDFTLTEPERRAAMSRQIARLSKPECIRITYALLKLTSDLKKIAAGGSEAPRFAHRRR